jgi:hypothetical protein
MYCLVSVDHNSIAEHLTRRDCEGVSEVLYIEWNGWEWWWYLYSYWTSCHAKTIYIGYYFQRSIHTIS